MGFVMLRLQANTKNFVYVCAPTFSFEIFFAFYVRFFAIQLRNCFQRQASCVHEQRLEATKIVS
jgi:hypothetical protein